VLYGKVVRRLLSHNSWHQRFSEEYVNTAVKTILDEAFDAGKGQIRLRLNELAAQFDGYATQRLVIVPIQGLKLGIDELRIATSS
jgi:hypothetical protein